jgi:hypothetical protein
MRSSGIPESNFCNKIILCFYFFSQTYQLLIPLIPLWRVHNVASKCSNS